MHHKNLTFSNIKLDRKMRIDKTIADLLLKENISRSKVQKIIQKDGIRVNGKVINDPKEMFEVIDFLEVSIEFEEQSFLKPKNSKSFKIVYEDEFLIVINKNAGITTHPGAGNFDDTLANELAYYSDKLSSINGDFRPGIVHRLDKDTSGLMVVAKDDSTHFFLSEQLKSRELSRKYYAICYGIPHLAYGTIKTNIERDPKNRLKMRVAIPPKGREAVTIYEVKAKYDNFSLIELTLKTGRTHQIRVHLTHIGHSILGDETYKVRDINKYRAIAFPRQALHAHSIGFIHPKTLENMNFSIEMPDDMNNLINELKNDR